MSQTTEAFIIVYCFSNFLYLFWSAWPRDKEQRVATKDLVKIDLETLRLYTENTARSRMVWNQKIKEQATAKKKADA